MLRNQEFLGKTTPMVVVKVTCTGETAASLIYLILVSTVFQVKMMAAWGDLTKTKVGKEEGLLLVVGLTTAV